MKKVLVIGAVLFVGLFAFFFKWLNQPNSGNVTFAPSNDVLSATKATVSLQGRLFSTNYDNSLRIKTSTEDESGPIYAQYMLGSKDEKNNAQIGITVADKESSVDDTSPAKLRLLDDSGYVQSTVQFTPEESRVFIRNSESGYEIAVIWQGEKYYSAVVGSGPAAERQQINEQVSDVVSNWTWAD